MPATPPPLPAILDQLEALHGPPTEVPSREPLELILWEAVAYLAPDAKRQLAFDALQAKTGCDPARIAKASDATLLAIAKLGGIMAEHRVNRLREIADIALEDHGGDLRALVALPPAKALKALQQFPGIGLPGAEKILLFSGIHPHLALESNALRTLMRLGYADEQKSYDKSYRVMREAMDDALPRECAPRIRAHQLLRIHGQEICRQNNPLCGSCPLRHQCKYATSQNR